MSKLHGSDGDVIMNYQLVNGQVAVRTATELGRLEYRHQRTSLIVYIPVVFLLYIGDLISGVWVLFYGLQFPTPSVSLISLLNWAGAWALCRFGYGCSEIFGYALVTLTVILTVLIIWLVIFAAWGTTVINEA